MMDSSASGTWPRRSNRWANPVSSVRSELLKKDLSSFGRTAQRLSPSGRPAARGVGPGHADFHRRAHRKVAARPQKSCSFLELPGRGLYQLAQHDYKPIPPKRAKLGPATCRILGSALAAWVSRGKGPPYLLGVPSIHWLRVSRSRTSSAWRCVSVLSNTCCKWVRTVVYETDNSPEICFGSAPRPMRRATSASLLVRP